MGEEGTRIRAMKWGLIPSFQSADSPIDHFRMFNARCETVFTLPSFRNLVLSRRCVAVFEGYYEWKQEFEGKQPVRKVFFFFAEEY